MFIFLWPLTLFLFHSTDPTKFFGCELGAQTQFDTKNDRYIVNGSHEANKLQDMLDGFIRKFVLCTECDNPETELVNVLRAKAGSPSNIFTGICILISLNRVMTFVEIKITFNLVKIQRFTVWFTQRV